MHATLRKVDRSVIDSLFPPQALRAGVWGLYRPTLDPNLGIVVTRTQAPTRCGRFRTHGRKCPRQY